jgi:hypothetical protein
LQYVDDTVIFLEANDEHVANLKFILYCFENMSGLKINFHKSEVIVLGASKEESIRLASCLNCKEREQPMKYLGVPVTSAKLYNADLISILIESSLSSLPNYTMGVYLLPEEVHHKMDSARANFFWDSGQKKEILYGEMD